MEVVISVNLGRCSSFSYSHATTKSRIQLVRSQSCIPCNDSQFSRTAGLAQLPATQRTNSPSWLAAVRRRRYSPARRRRASQRLPIDGDGDDKVKMDNSEGQVSESAVELEDALAFADVADDKGLISICGFGSLLSEKSARYTFPNLVNFRVAVLPDFRRVFAHVAPVFLERGIANVATKEMSSLSVEPFPGESIIVTVFEISISEVPAFIEREHEFRFLAATIHPLQAGAVPRKAGWIGNEEYHRRYGRFNIEQIWRDDILPCRVYLRHCVLAAKNLSQAAYDSFLDHTYLGDRITTIRQYLSVDEKIMQEQPPPSLCERYGG